MKIDAHGPAVNSPVTITAIDSPTRNVMMKRSASATSVIDVGKVRQLLEVLID